MTAASNGAHAEPHSTGHRRADAADAPTDGGDHPQSDTPDTQPAPPLACGADPDELLEQVANGNAAELNEHQRDCVHCQAALREFAELWAPMVSSADTPVPVPDDFTASVMKRVRSAAADTWYTLELTDGGKITIAARIVAQLARNAARRVPGVRVALGRSTAKKLARAAEAATLGHRHPHAAVGVLGRTAVVDLALAVTYGDPVHEVGHQVQQVVIDELRRNVGLKSVTVNVTVDDIIDQAP